MHLANLPQLFLRSQSLKEFSAYSWRELSYFISDVENISVFFNIFHLEHRETEEKVLTFLSCFLLQGENSVGLEVTITLLLFSLFDLVEASLKNQHINIQETSRNRQWIKTKRILIPEWDLNCHTIFFRDSKSCQSCVYWHWFCSSWLGNGNQIAML